MSALSSRMERFATLTSSGTMTQSDAYRDAYPASKNWKQETVHECASRLAANHKVSARVAEIQKAAAESAQLKASEILSEVKKLAHSDIGNVMHPDGRVKLPHELDAHTRASVKKFKIDELGRIEYEFWDKGAALDKAMRHLGLYEKDVETMRHVGHDGGPVKLQRIELIALEPLPKANVVDSAD